ncbi:MAG: glutaminase domain-containing protein [Fimbriimonas sp.]
MTQTSFRPPAVPLVTHSPYFSVWSNADRLTDQWPRHWTGAVHAMCGMVKIGDKVYRWMGTPRAEVPVMEQRSVEVRPTTTIYKFFADGVELTVTWRSSLLPDDLEVLTRPATYLTVEAKGAGNRPVQAYVDWSGEWVVNNPSQAIVGSQHKVQGLRVASLRSQEQPVLKKSGDDLRIDWGSLYIATRTAGTDLVVSNHDSRELFAASGKLADSDDLRFPRNANDEWPLIAATGDLTQPQTFVIAYDELKSVEYFNRPLEPYWRRGGRDVSALLKTVFDEERAIATKCDAFDTQLIGKLRRTGGEDYVHIGSLAYRQCIAGHTIVQDLDGDLLMFSKENFSNGCIGTVDVTFPASPFFLLFSPEMLEAQIRPICEYAESPRWRFPFAPHDLGTYPLANGQVYGGGERTEKDQMPVEECGNMLVMAGALCRVQGNTHFADKHWKVLSTWADYLLEKGLDPENQLCTDDFAGHMARNANLSLKAQVGLRAYAEICERKGEKARAAAIITKLQGWSKDWLKMASDGDTTRLAFDRPGTWSQKYNLVWDVLLGYDMFPKSLRTNELAHYLKVQNAYGLPLDNRADYTKTDWILWTATLADDAETFGKFLPPIVKSLNETTSRVPMTDWYDTKTAKMVGFQARTVVGGVFIRLLRDSGRLK